MDMIAEDINKLFKKIRYFVEEAIKYELYSELEESTQEYEFARTLFYENEDITKFRFYLLTDAYNKQRKKNIKDEEVAGRTVELNVWDITRIFDVVNSKAQKESVEIFLQEYACDGIPCVKAVEYVDVVADIEVMDSFIENPVVDVFVNLHEDFYQMHKNEEYEIFYADIPELDKDA